MIEGLCRSSGKPIAWRNHRGYGFPEPNGIETPLQLESVQAGFRTHYLYKANRCIDRSKLLDLKNLPYGEARKTLMTLSGVGKKVADCILLYSLDFLEAFPMDTWIKRGLRRDYFKGKDVGEKTLESFLFDHFGLYGGYAQLYLYHYWRNQTFK
jgi:N-glycosylase/DNA lyase